MATKVPDGMDKNELEDLMGTLLELRGQYRKLLWYGEVNKRGFVKITKKLDKKIESSNAQSQYLATKVDPKPFATNNKLSMDMRAINDWMSSLGEIKIHDDASSVHSSTSGTLHRVNSRSTLRIPPATLDAMDQAIRENNTKKLFDLLDTASPDASHDGHKKLTLDMLQRAITCKSFDCVASLVAKVPTIDDNDDMNRRNCLHRLIISIGRSRALANSTDTDGATELARTSGYITAAEPPVRAPGAFKVIEREASQTLGHEDPAIKLLAFILDRLSVGQRLAILTKDVYGRLPLHYAAQYGLVAATQALIQRMRKWGLFDVSEGIDSALWQDTDGFAPLHLAVMGGHYRTCRALLLAESWQDEHEALLDARKHVEKSGTALALATKSNFHGIVRLLVEAGVDVNHQDVQGETALHVAARFGYEECARALLDTTKDQKIDVELTEKTYGWTPLFIACVDGHLPIVELLIGAGADLNKSDYSGWTPKEHAALRGHLTIAQRLTAMTPAPSTQPSPEATARLSSSPPNSSSLEDRRSNAVSKNGSTNISRAPEPIKSFGHRYLQDEAMVLVSLGSMDNRKSLEPVILENIAMSDAHATQLDTALSLVVSAQGAKGADSVIDLPIQESISTSPFTFTTKDPTKVKILFDLIPTYSGSTKKVIGRAVALLSSIKPKLGSNRMTLQGDLSVPIVAADTLDIIGNVNFNFLIITPFQHPNMGISEDQTYWKSTSTMVIGHRGLGKNMAAQKSLQLGENTIQSFITAASLGAKYVEFDVQLTKDHVPVIYHDFLVSETGIDAPVHTLTLEQFLHVNDSSPRPRSPIESERGGRPPIRGRAQRSFSVGGPDQYHGHREKMDERMKYTRDFKEKGYKGNSRGNFVQSPFTTLEQMFHEIPEDVGFNIEMKYPMLFELEEQEMDTYAVELNSFVDTVLTKVYDLGKKRNIIFSSFNPDICLLLSFKQPSIPVLFLSDAGTAPVGDIRASSLQEAIRFASRWNLLGIVSSADPLVMCPRLVRVVKESGLVCVSYGALNNDVVNSRLQAQEGIDAVIVDSVLKIRQGLTEAEAGGVQQSQLANGTMVPGGELLKGDGKVGGV